MDYVSLHNHTTSSIMDSLIEIDDLFKRTKELGQKAVGITDHGTFASAFDALKISKKYDVKLIIGCEFYFLDDLNDTSKRLKHIILIAKNKIGYENLLSAHFEGFENKIISSKRVLPVISWEHLEKYSEGVIATTACSNGIISQSITDKNLQKAKDDILKLKSIFKDDLAIELQPHGLKRKATAFSSEVDQTFINRHLIKLAKELDVKYIVATDAHYINPEDAEAHDIMLAIGSGQPVESGQRLRYLHQDYNVPDFYIKSGEEVFNKIKRVIGEDSAKIALENTIYFSDKCEEPNWIDPKFSNSSGKELPEFPVKDQKDYNEFLEWLKLNKIDDKQEDEMYLRYRVSLGLTKFNKENDLEYLKRLEEEFNVIEYNKFSSYMLIVMDYIEYAKSQNISVGPGRGSIGGSLIAYLLDIHIADPIKYGLIFARFHNKEKKSFPDIDCDFSTFGRDKVKEYITNKYYDDHVAHVSNIMKMSPKPYVKSISRVFRLGGDPKEAVKVGNKIAEIIPAEAKKISVAFEVSPLLNEYAKRYPQLEKYSKHLDKKVVGWSTHAAGVVIGKRPLKNLVPLRKDKDGSTALELDKDQAEDNGLVKMDLLGLSTLDIIDTTLDLIKSLGKTPPVFTRELLESYDEKTYDLISSGNTFGVFQFGTSGGTIDLCKKYKPKSIEDLAVITTIARPSSKDFRQDYIDRKDLKTPISYLHPRLEPVLKRTFGYCIYDESLLDLARHVANWDYNQADVLRKMTKGKGKYSDKAVQWKNNFIQDCVKNNFTEKQANDFWDKIILPFEKYSFNKSHAVLYSMISYTTAYLLSNFPLEFLVANLMFEVKSNTKIAPTNILKIKEQIKSLNVKIIPPNINTSLETYKIIDEKTLMTGFDALKFMGKNAIPEILMKRPFNSLEDFLEKVDTRKVTSRAIQALAASGALDSFEVPRKIIYLYAGDFKKKYAAWVVKNKKNPNKYPEFKYPWPKEQDWSDSEKFSLEKLFLGEGLSGDKFSVFSGFFTRTAPSFKNLSKILPPPDSSLTESELRKYTKRISMLQGEVKDLFEFNVKKEDSKIFGQRMSKIRLEDPFGNQIVMTCFPDGLKKLHERISQLSNKKHQLEIGCGMYLTCDLNWFDGELSLLFVDITKFTPPPQMPKDLTSKKINLRKPKDEEEEIIPEEKEEDRNFLLDLIEEELVEEGCFDFEDEND